MILVKQLNKLEIKGGKSCGRYSVLEKTALILIDELELEMYKVVQLIVCVWCVCDGMDVVERKWWAGDGL